MKAMQNRVIKKLFFIGTGIRFQIADFKCTQILKKINYLSNIDLIPAFVKGFFPPMRIPVPGHYPCC